MQNTSNGLSVAALVLSIVGVLTMMFGGSVVLGSLAILLALLSRGSGRMSGQAKAAIGISIVSIALGILLLIGMFVYVFTSSDAQEMYRDYLRYYEDQLDDDDPYNYYNDYLDDYQDHSDEYLDYISPDLDHVPYHHDTAPGVTIL
ncbi:MAG: DUF4190 domain-containing protein [Lachnospiraceae bacterium]